MAKSDERHVQFSEREARISFRKWVETQGSQRSAAAKLKVTVGYVNDMMHGRRRLSDAALRRVKMRRVVKEVYESK